MENENAETLASLQDAGGQTDEQDVVQDTASMDAPAAHGMAVSEPAAESQAAEGEMQTAAPKRTAGERFAAYFTATRISYIAIFTALSYVLGLLDFSILPAVPFLKVDFSNTFVMIAGFSLGPVAGTIVAVLKELLHAITFGQTAFVGELANILMVLPYMLIPAIVYHKHKGIKVVIVTLILGCIAQCIVCIPVNYLLNFPAYLMAFTGSTWREGMDYFLDLWYFALAFNAIKTVLVSVATLIVYKPLSRLIKLTAAKFDKMKDKRAKAKKAGR
ncbi:MAG: ECF transporter S component [Clostridia bacterium]|nr:ECF transporter S component [Clostridia bacterium]